jgi:hypothetical protein
MFIRYLVSITQIHKNTQFGLGYWCEILKKLDVSVHHHQPIKAPTARAQAFCYGLHIRRMGHNPPHGPSAGWWVLTTVNAAGTNS